MHVSVAKIPLYSLGVATIAAVAAVIAIEANAPLVMPVGSTSLTLAAVSHAAIESCSEKHNAIAGRIQELSATQLMN